VFAHCRTSIVAEFRTRFPDRDRIEGNRAVGFAAGELPAAEEIRPLIASALTYHLKRRDPR